MKRWNSTPFWVLVCAVVTTACGSKAEFGSTQKMSYDQIASQVYSFLSSVIEDAEVAVDDSGRYMSFDLTQTESTPFVATQQQITRGSFNEQAIQGHPARFSREEFQLSSAGMLDLLLVIDDSRSMEDENAMVAQGLAPLISEFKNTDWQIAVISMSSPCISEANLIRSTDANAALKFKVAVNKWVDSDATEQGFPMAIQAIKNQQARKSGCGPVGPFTSWLRPGSSLGIMFVSDEENCGSDPGEQDRCKNLIGKNAGEMVGFLRGIRPAAESKIYSLVDTDDTCPTARAGGMYVEASTLTGGKAGSICHEYSPSTGYTNFLKNVSKDVSRIIKKQFTLSATPDMSQFNLYIDGQSVPSDTMLSISGRTITIDPTKVNSNALKIRFDYTHDAVPMFSEIALQNRPNPDTIKVSINNGALVKDRDFNYDEPRNTVKFVNQPPAEGKVSIGYLENRPLKSKFLLDLSGLREDTLKVSLNGVEQTTDKFQVSHEGLEFLTPPVDGSVVQVKWKTDAQKKLEYPASITDARKPVAWTVRDKSTGKDLEASWDGKKMKFDPKFVQEGRVVNVSVDFGEKSALRTLELPTDRIDDQVQIFADGKPDFCQVMPDKTSLTSSFELAANDSWKSRYKGKQIDLKCQPGFEYTNLKVRYKQEVSRVNKFQVALPQDQDADSKSLVWKVYLNGVPTKEFKRSGKIIELPDELLSPESKIDVQVKVYSTETR